MILAYWVRHTNEKLHMFRWDLGMVWILLKYMLFRRKKVVFTVTKSNYSEEYFVRFYVEQ